MSCFDMDFDSYGTVVVVAAAEAAAGELNL